MSVLHDALPYAPTLAYLLVVTLLLWASGRVPHWLHLVALVLGLTCRVLQSGWTEPLVTVGIAFGLFVVLVGLAARTVTAVSLFGVVVALALTPLNGWVGLGVGLLVAAVVAGVRTSRNLGGGTVTMLAMDTMSAVGVSPAGHIKRPELALIPSRDDLTDVHQDTDRANRMRMYLPPYLLLGSGLAAATVVLF